MEQIDIHTDFAVDVLSGLSAKQKFLSSKYFYDEKGSKIFQDIMQMPEYYLTDCELEIFKNSQQEILDAFSENNASFDLVELGAGDGIKTKILLSHFLSQKAKFKYSPIDISEDSVVNLVAELNHDLPELKVNGLIGDYFDLMKKIIPNGYTKKIILFLGSNIGNYNEQMSLEFLGKLKDVLYPQDMLFIGFDMKKDPDVILKAYNDPHGHTAAFNLNLLQRINDELNADFNLENFYHKEEYNPQTGTASSFLISKIEQHITINEFSTTIQFTKGERIFMEISQKYDLDIINELALKSGFEVVRNFFDERLYFTNSLWKLKS